LFDESTDAPDLKPTYEALLPHIAATASVSGAKSKSESESSHGVGADTGAVVVLDGLAELLWIGFEPVDVGRFVRAVFAKVRSVRCVGTALDLRTVTHGPRFMIHAP
jgi:hypothetical protein